MKGTQKLHTIQEKRKSDMSRLPTIQTEGWVITSLGQQTELSNTRLKHWNMLQLVDEDTNLLSWLLRHMFFCVAGPNGIQLASKN